MICIHCGKKVPFIGDTCPYCRQPKVESQLQQVIVVIFGFIGMIIGGIIGYMINSVGGSFVGGFVGMIIGMIIGFNQSQKVINQSKITKAQPMLSDKNDHQQITTQPMLNSNALKLKRPPIYQFDCPHCQTKLEGDNTMLGSPFQCPACGKQILIDT